MVPKPPYDYEDEAYTMAAIILWVVVFFVCVTLVLVVVIGLTEAKAGVIKPEPPVREFRQPKVKTKPCRGFYVTTDSAGNAVMAVRDLPAIKCLMLPPRGWRIEGPRVRQ